MITLKCSNPACGKVTRYRSWDAYMNKQLNSVPYCPRCGHVVPEGATSRVVIKQKATRESDMVHRIMIYMTDGSQIVCERLRPAAGGAPALDITTFEGRRVSTVQLVGIEAITIRHVPNDEASR